MICVGSNWCVIIAATLRHNAPHAATTAVAYQLPYQCKFEVSGERKICSPLHLHVFPFRPVVLHLPTRCPQTFFLYSVPLAHLFLPGNNLCSLSHSHTCSWFPHHHNLYLYLPLFPPCWFICLCSSVFSVSVCCLESLCLFLPACQLTCLIINLSAWQTVYLQ